MEIISAINNKINSIVWGNATIIIFLGIGIYFTIRLKLLPIRKIRFIFKNTFKTLFCNDIRKTTEKNSFSTLQSILTSLATTIGTGSVVGVATALSIGGSGSIFWMWVSAFFGMSIAYAENVLGILYKNKYKSSYSPFLYMEKGVGSKALAKVSALFCVLVSLGMGNMVQANSISSSLQKSFFLDKKLCGLVLFVIVSFVMLGGIKTLGNACMIVVPFVTILFILGSLFLIIINYKSFLPTACSIFKNAFCFKACVGGVGGSAVKKAISIGIRRGVFSNEAGLGSTVVVHSSSEITEPVIQGAWSIFEVFIDTFVVCTLTAFVILQSGVMLSVNEGSEIVIKAFETGFSSFGEYFVSISISLFAFATLLGWSFIGKKAWAFLFSDKLEVIYKLLFCIFIYFGSITSLNLVWDISDTFNGLMAFPNLFAIMFLSKGVIKETKRYFKS